VNELDETLGRVMQDTAGRYRPSEIAAARERFSRRGRRRRVMRAGAAVAVAAACIAGVAFLARPEVISGRPIRPASGTVITVGDAPISVAIYDGAAWVVNRGDGTVTRVDGGTREVEEIDLGDEAEPASITAGENALWFTDGFLPGFAPIEPKERTVPTSFPVAGPGSDVTFGDIVVGEVAGKNEVWISNTLDGEPRLSTFRVVGEPGAGGHVSLDGEGMAELAIGGSGVWVSYTDSVGPFEVSKPSSKVASVTGAGDLAYGDGAVWTVVEGGAVIRLVPNVRKFTEGEDGGVIRQEFGDIEISAKIPANAESGAQIAFGEGSVWVVSGSNGDGELVQIDPAKDEVVGRFALSGGPFAVAAGDGWLWVTDEGGDRIMRIDPQSPGGRSSTP
jgi:streptogramin lyase